MKNHGFIGVKPIIRKIGFPRKEVFSVFFEDGRVLTIPTSAFPMVAKLTPEQRKTWYVIDDMGFSFDACDEVFHVEELFGLPGDYRYSFLTPHLRRVAETSPEQDRGRHQGSMEESAKNHVRKPKKNRDRD